MLDAGRGQGWVPIPRTALQAWWKKLSNSHCQMTWFNSDCHACPPVGISFLFHRTSAVDPFPADVGKNGVKLPAAISLSVPCWADPGSRIDGLVEPWEPLNSWRSKRHAAPASWHTVRVRRMRSHGTALRGKPESPGSCCHSTQGGSSGLPATPRKEDSPSVETKFRRSCVV